MTMNLQTIFQDLVSWFLSSGIKVVFIFLFAYFINRFLRIFIEKTISKVVKDKIDEEARRKRLKTLISIFRGTSRFVVWILAVLMVLPEFGVNVAPVLASIGLAGLAVGMAAKDVISDFIAGFFILLEDQYRVGDRIKIAGVEGEVLELTLRRTILRDDKGDLHSVPNSQIKTVTKLLRKEE